MRSYVKFGITAIVSLVNFAIPVAAKPSEDAAEAIKLGD